MTPPRRRLGHHPFSTHHGPAPTPAGRLALAAVDDTALGEAADLCEQLGIPLAYARKVAAAVAVCPTLPRTEPADPVTTEEAQELFDALAHPCVNPDSCESSSIWQAAVSDLMAQNPNVHPAAIGAVVIHVAGMTGLIVENLRKKAPVDVDATGNAIRLIAGAGAALYLGATHPDPFTPAKEG